MRKPEHGTLQSSLRPRSGRRRGSQREGKTLPAHSRSAQLNVYSRFVATDRATPCGQRGSSHPNAPRHQLQFGSSHPNERFSGGRVPILKAGPSRGSLAPISCYAAGLFGRPSDKAAPAFAASALALGSAPRMMTSP
ncbi:hypothetical protein LdCL_220020500 [Leishmania donovani]|uniref:Uncharacterized protein n=1 Tax=Leishmania donovani TaxID=5661 RepID=A0A3S7WXD2_LEIDO|nr:hypothetical protein LdCL_220020500 [Leishmania donovani]